jgi:hypothetical protein
MKPPDASVTSTPPPRNADEAREHIIASERELAQLLPEGDEANGQVREPAPPADAPVSPSPMPGQPTGIPGAQGDSPSPMRAPESRASRCAVACSALGSMRRAADRLCELQGENDDACTDARSRVERSQTRVRRSCPSCQ